MRLKFLNVFKKKSNKHKVELNAEQDNMNLKIGGLGRGMSRYPVWIDIKNSTNMKLRS